MQYRFNFHQIQASLSANLLSHRRFDHWPHGRTGHCFLSYSLNEQQASHRSDDKAAEGANPLVASLRGVSRGLGCRLGVQAFVCWSFSGWFLLYGIESHVHLRLERRQLSQERLRPLLLLELALLEHRLSNVFHLRLGCL